MNISQKKRAFACAAIIFLLFVLLIPFIVSTLYEIGKTYPTIIWPFSPGEMLTYCVTVLGVAISLCALFVALSANDPKVKIERVVCRSSEGPYKEGISVINESQNEIVISEVGLISPRKINGHRLLMGFGPAGQCPKRIAPFGVERFEYEQSDFAQKIAQFKETLEQRHSPMTEVIYFVKLANGYRIEYKSKSDRAFIKKN